MDLELAGKTALVTGATAGIGYAIALGMPAEGTRVIMNGRTESGWTAGWCARSPDLRAPP